MSAAVCLLGREGVDALSPLPPLQVDVEGWEWSVMQGAAGLIRSFTVDNIIMEYSPGESSTYQVGHV